MRDNEKPKEDVPKTEQELARELRQKKKQEKQEAKELKEKEKIEKQEMIEKKKQEKFDLKEKKKQEKLDLKDRVKITNNVKAEEPNILDNKRRAKKEMNEYLKEEVREKNKGDLIAEVETLIESTLKKLELGGKGSNIEEVSEEISEKEYIPKTLANVSKANICKGIYKFRDPCSFTFIFFILFASLIVDDHFFSLFTNRYPS